MVLQQAALAICVATLAHVLYGRYRNSVIRDVPGPRNPSWIHGHQWYWRLEEGYEVERRLLEEYGTIAHWNGPLGEGRLWIADPKAVQRILQGSGYLYEKLDSVKEMFATLIDRGLGWASGDAHKLQRRAMAPAFGLPETKALFPYFSKCSDLLADKWHEVISSEGSGKGAVIDMQPWLSKATLDAIGAGALGYDFGALENADNKLAKSYMDLLTGILGIPSKERVFMMNVLRWTPNGFVAWMFERDQSPEMVMARKNREYAHEVATKLIREKKQELEDGTSRRDILSLLVKTSSTPQPELRQKDEQIVAQVLVIMFAGHESTSKALVFTLLELAKNPRVQERLRAEVMETLEKIRARGDSDFSVNDFDSMPYLIAVGKESLRVHPAAPELQRVATKNDVLPLAKPFMGVSGNIYRELPIPAGTLVSVSLAGYNMNKDVWGPDAYEFRPERWLEMKKDPETHVGVYGNISTFSGGARGCIGWRFAITEMHTFLVTLLRQFDFSLPDNDRVMRVLRGEIVFPAIAGEEHKGAQLPLKVTALRND